MASTNGGTYDCKPRYECMASANSLFHASTAVAGVAPGTALSTTPPMVLWNPPASGKMAAIVRVRIAYLSGALGAGSVVYARADQITVPSGGTELVPISGALQALSGTIRAFQGSTLTNTPTIVAPAFTLTAAPSISPGQDEVAGELCILPGQAFAIQAIAAAGTNR